MFDGNTFLPVTGTPIRKMACMMRPLADADPVPFAVAILKAKSLTRSMRLPSICTYGPQRHRGLEKKVADTMSARCDSRSHSLWPLSLWFVHPAVRLFEAT